MFGSGKFFGAKVEEVMFALGETLNSKEIEEELSKRGIQRGTDEYRTAIASEYDYVGDGMWIPKAGPSEASNSNERSDVV